NRHRERYDFKQLIAVCPELAPFVTLNKYDDESVDFFNPEAVKMLNKALLAAYYDIGYWDIPENYLCPPIPGRADYIHTIADLLGSRQYGKTPTGEKIKCLDIGVGANCVYPIIGVKEYGWSFIGSDIDPVAIASAQKIVDENAILRGKVELRLQPNAEDIFKGIIAPDEKIDLTICNPPFHASLADAQAGTLRKLTNLTEKKTTKPILNFGGHPNELWCEGGERVFAANMIMQSKEFASNVFWFSTLISKQTHLKMVYAELRYAEAVDVKTFPMGQGNKSSRLVAWTFLSPETQKEWVKERWQE
ncbi:MAG TPA: 23S rRNA (adenine(1618)-N(6))-methyltransferase RlmF, partial [Saprospiraceae bacterium]|nr:23S rRNA (adenine(1618)-N(6))-methyltransferase RlmF [Saprospiraceae bacterium]